MSLDLSQHSTVVAPALLGSVLHGPNGSGKIVEVEAYGGDEDLASHACRGVTPRSKPMFGAAGTLYVYLIYGMHHCANVVTGAAGDGQAVLIRAVEPIVITDRMRHERPKARRDFDISNGPGKLCAALGIDRGHDGLNLLDQTSGVRLDFGQVIEGQEIATSTRIGISVAQDYPWRWYLRDNKWVSKLT